MIPNISVFILRYSILWYAEIPVEIFLIIHSSILLPIFCVLDPCLVKYADNGRRITHDNDPMAIKN